MISLELIICKNSYIHIYCLKLKLSTEAKEAVIILIIISI